MPLEDAQYHENPLRPLPSWIDYSQKEVDRSSYHIGEGFLEVGCFVMLIGPSYVGKSTLLAQLTINFSIGRSWLFFRLSRPLRVMIVQAEDPENKLIKMGKMVHQMELSDDEITLAHQNTAVLPFEIYRIPAQSRKLNAMLRFSARIYSASTHSHLT